MIPGIAHFIWFGTALPWAHVLSIQSAAARGGFERVVLHHADDLSASPWWRSLMNTPGFEARPLDPQAVLQEAGPHGPELSRLFDRMNKPAAKANMVRAALLYQEGGVYLDLDTVTIKSLTPLREEAAVFCGEEHIALPHDVAHNRSPGVLVAAGLRLAARDVLRRLPDGWRHFRRIEGFYHRAVNNAVFASAPEHPFVAELLRRMIVMDPAQQMVRFALGTHLLQKVVRDYDGDDLRVHAPPAFYPLPPEISEHWFRPTRALALDEALLPETRVVHWYASVRTKHIVPRIDPGHVRRHAHEELFSALASPFL